MTISYLTCTNFKSTIVYLIKSFSIHILLHSKAIVFSNDNFICTLFDIKTFSRNDLNF